MRCFEEDEESCLLESAFVLVVVENMTRIQTCVCVCVYIYKRVLLEFDDD